METVITALIVVGVMVLAIVGITNRSLSAQATIAQASQAMQEREGQRTRTNLSALSAATDGTTVQVILRNTGTTKLADFGRWDVLLQYTDENAQPVLKWYPFNEQGVESWNEQIFQNASTLVPEVVNPNVFDPGEEMIVTVSLQDPVGSGTTNLATVATPNGVTASAVFSH